MTTYHVTLRWRCLKTDLMQICVTQSANWPPYYTTLCKTPNFWPEKLVEVPAIKPCTVPDNSAFSSLFISVYPVLSRIFVFSLGKFLLWNCELGIIDSPHLHHTHYSLYSVLWIDMSTMECSARAIVHAMGHMPYSQIIIIILLFSAKVMWSRKPWSLWELIWPS